MQEEQGKEYEEHVLQETKDANMTQNNTGGIDTLSQSGSGRHHQDIEDMGTKLEWMRHQVFQIGINFSLIFMDDIK